MWLRSPSIQRCAPSRVGWCVRAVRVAQTHCTTLPPRAASSGGFGRFRCDTLRISSQYRPPNVNKEGQNYAYMHPSPNTVAPITRIRSPSARAPAGPDGVRTGACGSCESSEPMHLGRCKPPMIVACCSKYLFVCLVVIVHALIPHMGRPRQVPVCECV